MSTPERKKIFLKDYRPPTHQVRSTELWFDIYDDHTIVRQRTKFQAQGGATELFLDGEELECVSLKIDGIAVDLKDMKKLVFIENGLRLLDLAPQFELDIVTTIHPEKNTALEGLYKSSNYYCTQCEAQGFRRITYFLDRPDVMTVYRVHISADQKSYPVLLSNGNKIGGQTLPDNRHQVSWEDPFKKPCYLFALVAGDLGVLKDQFITQSKRKIDLEIYSPHGTQDRCQHAMESLKKSMRWDEERFGREYDLDIFMILAVDDFNMGAMENKGLNIFNSRLVYANPQTATDAEYAAIESVVAHEYFHNWTGNRITVRDWFHLSLKEGLTVFRDEEFSMDLASREQLRIDHVSGLRSSQFLEDAGPNAHPIRPESCYAVDNFYTTTIYEKGAEIIRMMQTMVGRPGFRKGMDKYFEEFDGHAVITEDFAGAISSANGQDWQQFQRWYSQKGTPQIQVTESFNASAGTYELELKQDMSPALQIPLVFGLLEPSGKEVPATTSDDIFTNSENQTILNFRQPNQSWTFKGLREKPVLSLNRTFSAPVNITWPRPESDLFFLMKHDTDAFNRWDASQEIYNTQYIKLLSNPQQALDQKLIEALQALLTSERLDEGLKAKFLQIPSQSVILQRTGKFDAESFDQARQSFRLQIAKQFGKTLSAIYDSLHGKDPFSKVARVFGQRELKNSALIFLSAADDHALLAKRQFSSAQIMTDEVYAYSCLAQNARLADAAHEQFHAKWKNESGVLNKWFEVQATSRLPDTFDRVVRLCEHPDFHIKNPNRVYSLLRAFGNNLVRFHDPAVDGYTFFADKVIELDALNPQVATRLVSAFNIWKQLPANQQKRAEAQLQRLARASLSKNTFELVENQLR